MHACRLIYGLTDPLNLRTTNTSNSVSAQGTRFASSLPAIWSARTTTRFGGRRRIP
jgi:hypothetical protein